ncbi:MAG: phosphoenolpyruvate synthase, partial [Verrucomicrobia bacterium]|nr:phosphoenolpyruvate synthase [Verrucomicrobiota bacterium]
MQTLASFSQPIGAHLLRARLEGSGIASYVRDENMVAVDWLYSNALGGVKVDVADEDYERALQVMES